LNQITPCFGCYDYKNSGLYVVHSERGQCCIGIFLFSCRVLEQGLFYFLLLQKDAACLPLLYYFLLITKGTLAQTITQYVPTVCIKLSHSMLKKGLTLYDTRVGNAIYICPEASSNIVRCKVYRKSLSHVLCWAFLTRELAYSSMHLRYTKKYIIIL